MITVQEITNFIIELVKTDYQNIIESFINRIKNIDNAYKKQIEEGNFVNKIRYLLIYAYIQYVYKNFPHYFEEFERLFFKKLRKEFIESLNEKPTRFFEPNLRNMLNEYSREFNKIAEEKEGEDNLIKFFHFTSKSIFGEGLGDDIRTVMMVSSLYVSSITGLDETFKPKRK